MRALKMRCPKCGSTPLFASYLRAVDHCPACHEAWGQIRADDGPTWLTIVIVGHIMAPILVIAVPETMWPEWVSLVVWLGLALVLSLLVLPRAKALFIAMIWQMKCSGAKK